MTRISSSLATSMVFVSIVFFYFYNVPNHEGIPQPNRVRRIHIAMKLVNFFGFVSETLGIAPMWYIQRQSGYLLKKLKGREDNPELKIEDRFINDVLVRVYRPIVSETSQKVLQPAIIFYHGGAFYMGSVDTHHSITRDMARQTGFIVISVEYRLAPENPFPDGLNDCLAIAKYFLEQDNAQLFNIDSARVAIAGDSAGGNLAAVVTMRLINAPLVENQPRLQVLIYPALQFFDQNLPSNLNPGLQIFYFGRPGLVLQLYLNKSISDDISTNNHTSVVQKQTYRRWIDWSMIPDQYRQTYKAPMNDHLEGNPTLIENCKQALHSDVSPLLVDDDQLSLLPPTYILTVGHDRLRDQGFIYSGRLKKNGVNTIHRHYENTFHGSLTFLDGPFELDIAHEMLGEIVCYLKENL